jgi:hypothetical protein
MQCLRAFETVEVGRLFPGVFLRTLKTCARLQRNVHGLRDLPQVPFEDYKMHALTPDLHPTARFAHRR